MKNDIEEGSRLAAEIATRPSPTSHLPKEVARAAIAYTQRRHSAGASQVLIARELGVSMMTVRRWIAEGGAATTREPGRTKTRTTKLRAVRVLDTERAAVTAIVATTRDGLRIEGLTVSDLVAVLRGLG